MFYLFREILCGNVKRSNEAGRKVEGTKKARKIGFRQSVAKSQASLRRSSCITPKIMIPSLFEIQNKEQIFLNRTCRDPGGLVNSWKHLVNLILYRLGKPLSIYVFIIYLHIIGARRFFIIYPRPRRPQSTTHFAHLPITVSPHHLLSPSLSLPTTISRLLHF